MNGGYRPWGHKELDTTDPAIKKLAQIFLNVAGQCQPAVARTDPTDPRLQLLSHMFPSP